MRHATFRLAISTSEVRVDLRAMVHLQLAQTTPTIHLSPQPRRSEEDLEEGVVASSLIAVAAEEVDVISMIEETCLGDGTVALPPGSDETYREMAASPSVEMTGDLRDVTMSVEAIGSTENANWIDQDETCLQAH